MSDLCIDIAMELGYSFEEVIGRRLTTIRVIDLDGEPLGRGLHPVLFLPRWDTDINAALALPLLDGDTWFIQQAHSKYSDYRRLWQVLIESENGDLHNTPLLGHESLAESICICWLAYRKEARNGS